MSDESPHAVLEEAGVGFDPTTQHLDLSKEEKRRTTAVMLAINAYKEFIIREAEYLREAASLARLGEGPALRPATVDGIMEIAIKFDDFITNGPLPPAAEKLPKPRAAKHAGKQKGGKARAAKLPPERRKEIAKGAAEKRWEKPQ